VGCLDVPNQPSSHTRKVVKFYSLAFQYVPMMITELDPPWIGMAGLNFPTINGCKYVNGAESFLLSWISNSLVSECCASSSVSREYSLRERK
jgi:hypothetical protein